MNQPIRCQPLPILPTNGEAMAEAPLCTDGDNADFRKLLNEEIGEASVDPEEGTELQRQIEALGAYGAAAFSVPMAAVLPFPEVKLMATACAALPQDEVPAPPEGLQLACADAVIRRKELSNQAQAEAKSNLVNRLQPGISPEQTAVSVEQKVPATQPEFRPALAQISPKELQGAKNSSGMVAAQPPPMLTTSSSQEETAPHTGQMLRLDHFEDASFQQPIRFQPSQSKAFPRQEAHLSEPPLIEIGFGQAPRFETLAGDVEVQPLRAPEPSSVVDAIRTHVELLKSSTAEKLDVVLRPDAQTELRLQVERVNGEIHVLARCDRGDFTALEMQWGTIQNTLASQGIRVEPLQQGQGAQLQQNGAQDFQGFSGQHSNQREERPAAIFEQDLRKREGTQAKTSRGGTARGWQSWA